MDINSVVSRLKGPKELNDKECIYLKEVLDYVYKNGAEKFMNGELFKSNTLTSLQHKNLLTSDAVLSEFIRKLSKSEPESVKNIIHYFKNILKEKSRQAHQRRSERKSIRSSMYSENIDRKYAPPSEDGSFPGGPGYLKLQRHFNSLQERDSTSQPPHKRTRFGGKHKRHNTNKTRRQRRRQTGR